MSCLTEAFKVEYFLHSLFGTIFLFQCNNYVPQKNIETLFGALGRVQEIVK